MPQYFKSEFSTELALSVLNDVQYQRSNYYSFLGKCDPWPLTDLVKTEPQTNAAVDYANIRNNMVYLKRVAPNDIAMALDRLQHTWSESFAPLRFDSWDDAVDHSVTNKKFYCVTNEWNVYKCLNNNWNGATSAESTVKPTLTQSAPFKTADGYVWKYMYTIPPSKITKFVTSEYIPVQVALSDSFYNKGSVESVVIINGGSGYVDNPKTQLVVDPPTTGNVAQLVASVSAYDQYDVTGTEMIRPAGTIVKVTIVDPGSGYVTAPAIGITDINLQGVGIYGNATAKLTAIVFEGKIVNVVIEDPGKNYGSDTTSSISIFGDGTDAKFTPVVFGGSLVDVIIENAGIGYNAMKLQMDGNQVGLGGTNAEMFAVIGASDYTSNQAYIEQDAITYNGCIYSAVVEDGGTGYAANSTLTVEGDGAGFSATPVVIDGIVRYIDILNFGTGYTYVTLTVVDPSNSNFTDAIVRAVLPPAQGHGFNAIDELGSTTVAICSYIQKDAALDTFSQDYRHVGVLKNPRKKVTNLTFREQTAVMCFEVIMNTVTDLQGSAIGAQSEDVLKIGNSSFRIISIQGNHVLLLQIDNKYVQPIGKMTCLRNSNEYESIQIVSTPIVDRFSGKLLYVAEEDPFSFVDNQGLSIKTFLKF